MSFGVAAAGKRAPVAWLAEPVEPGVADIVI
jgi:hypothetical protein